MNLEEVLAAVRRLDGISERSRTLHPQYQYRPGATLAALNVQPAGWITLNSPARPVRYRGTRRAPAAPGRGAFATLVTGAALFAAAAGFLLGVLVR